MDAQHGDGWTAHGIAFSMIALAQDDIKTTARALMSSDTHAATDAISEAIAQLEAARRMIA
jgi:hypothetical protein